jgi:hypothetical protein
MRLSGYLNPTTINESEEDVDFVEEFIKKGKAKEKGITEKDVDPEQLKMGIKVEYEHTSSEFIAKRIALDHLAECDDYYTRLNKMELSCEE